MIPRIFAIISIILSNSIPADPQQADLNSFTACRYGYAYRDCSPRDALATRFILQQTRDSSAAPNDKPILWISIIIYRSPSAIKSRDTFTLKHNDLWPEELITLHYGNQTIIPETSVLVLTHINREQGIYTGTLELLFDKHKSVMINFSLRFDRNRIVRCG